MEENNKNQTRPLMEKFYKQITHEDNGWKLSDCRITKRVPGNFNKRFKSPRGKIFWKLLPIYASKLT